MRQGTVHQKPSCCYGFMNQKRLRTPYVPEIQNYELFEDRTDRYSDTIEIRRSNVFSNSPSNLKLDTGYIDRRRRPVIVNWL
jgi:hypothetical protein